MPKSRKRQQAKGRRARKWLDPLALDQMFDKVVGFTNDIEVPRFLYHYTSWASAKGIISSQQFSATAHHCTNDEAELVSANSIIVEVAIELRKNAVGAATKVLDLFVAEYPEKQIARMITVCLACFSVARDDKAQWMRYGDNGNGVCLGVRVIDEAPPEGSNGRLVIVDYSEASWRKTLREELSKICSVFSRPDFLTTPMNCKLGVSALNRVAAFASISAKQAQWASEQEVRHATLVPHGSRAQLRERKSAGQVKQYLPITVRAGGKRIAFSEITIGPNRSVEETREQLAHLLKEAGYKEGDEEYPEIKMSALAPWELSEPPAATK
jgi:Protein of unknown function (DUF2971)